MACKHKLHFTGKIRKCVGHEEIWRCMQLGFLNDPKGGGHKDYVCFVCEKCGEEIERETQESKKIWRRGYENDVSKQEGDEK